MIELCHESTHNVVRKNSNKEVQYNARQSLSEGRLVILIDMTSLQDVANDFVGPPCTYTMYLQRSLRPYASRTLSSIHCTSENFLLHMTRPL